LIDYTQNIIDTLIKTSRVYINRIIEAVTLIEQSDKYQEDETVSSLIYSSCRLLSQNINMSYLYDNQLLEAPSYPINLEYVLKVIISECSEQLKPIKRELQLTIDGQVRSLVQINEKAFTIAFMNLLQNALLYSPPKSTVIITLDNQRENHVCIKITNLAGLNTYKANDEHSGLGIPLCFKIAEHCNGALVHSESEGKTVADLQLPLAPESNALPLSTEFSDYISERFRPTRLFMYEVLAQHTNNYTTEKEHD